MLGAGLTSTQLLIEARRLIEAGWCRGASARDKRGMPTPFNEKTAVCFCMGGALVALCNIVLPAYIGAVQCLKQVVGTNIATWNDDSTRTQEEVLLAYDQAIEISLDKLRGSASVAT